jgi:inorganic pyrophosphatase
VHDSLDDLPELLRAEIEQFFSIYKDLENKRVVVDGWRSREDAIDEIRAARARFDAASEAGTVTEHRGPGGRLPGPERRQ